MAPPHHRRVASGSLAEFAQLMETLPTGRGPATTARREAIWRQVSAERNARSMGPLAAMDQGLRYIEELEHTLPAGSKPLVMHAFQAASDVAAEFAHFATEERVENGEMFRLTLIAMRQYLELYAVVCGGHGLTHGSAAPRVRPVAVTLAEFEQAVPLLRKWGVRVPDTEATFRRLDKLGGGVVKFDEFARWMMRTQMEALSNAVLFRSSTSSTKPPSAGGRAGSLSASLPLPPHRPASATPPSARRPHEQRTLTSQAMALGATDRKAVALAHVRKDGRGYLVPDGAGPHRGVTAPVHPRSTVPLRPRPCK